MHDFRKVRAWQSNRQLTVDVYRITRTFPADERFGLVSQIRRAVVSVGANIAEGCGRHSDADKLRFLQMSFASSTELLHHLITSTDLGYLQPDAFGSLESKLDVVRSQLYGFIKRLRGAVSSKQ